MNRSEAGKLGNINAQKTLIAQKNQRIDNYLLNPNLCIYCLNIIPYNKRFNNFCSKSCSASYNNKIRDRYLKYKKCSCGNEFNYKSGNIHNKFCPKCILEEKHIHRKTNINDCKADPSRRKILIKKYGYKCFICMNAEWNGLVIPIELDHIDGDSSNNIESNLRLLCPNCHAQTATYKNKNKGNGRKIRMQTYYKNKSR